MADNNIIGIIGDVHGCYFTLVNLYIKIKDKCMQIYSTGDLIDRGKYSKEVIQFAIDKKIFPVRGNHEDMLLNAIEHSDDKKIFGYGNSEIDTWYAIGGKQTQNSYIKSISFEKFKLFKNEIVSKGHLDFIKSFPLMYKLEKILISHGGYIENRPDENVLWNRRLPSVLEAFQVFGHTPVDKPELIEGHYLNIDTGCVYGRRLTAVIMDIEKGNVLDLIQERVNENDIS